MKFSLEMQVGTQEFRSASSKTTANSAKVKNSVGQWEVYLHGWLVSPGIMQLEDWLGFPLEFSGWAG